MRKGTVLVFTRDQAGNLTARADAHDLITVRRCAALPLPFALFPSFACRPSGWKWCTAVQWNAQKLQELGGLLWWHSQYLSHPIWTSLNPNNRDVPMQLMVLALLQHRATLYSSLPRACAERCLACALSSEQRTFIESIGGMRSQTHRSCPTSCFADVQPAAVPRSVRPVCGGPAGQPQGQAHRR